MFQSRAEYDRGVNTFSPEGRLFQVEYAMEAIKLGSTAIGIQASNGVVLAVERRLISPLLVPSSVDKIFEIDRHVGCAVSGLTADARLLVEHARVEGQNHRFTYNEPMTTESLTQSICDMSLKFGENRTEEMGTIISRPFGVSLLIAGLDADGTHLYCADPSGTYMNYAAKAIGSAAEVAQSQLLEEYKKGMDIEDALQLAIKVLSNVMEDKISHKNSQIAVVTPEQGFKLLNSQEINKFIKI